MIGWSQDNIKYKPFIRNHEMIAVTLKELREENFQTGLRELVGSMKRSGDKEAFRNYTKNERFRNLDSRTSDAISVMVGEPRLRQLGERYRNVEGGLDMCKAIRDLIEDGRVEGIEIGTSKGIKIGTVKGIFELLADLGIVTDDLHEKIMNEQNLSQLSVWLKLAAKSESLDYFEEHM